MEDPHFLAKWSKEIFVVVSTIFGVGVAYQQLRGESRRQAKTLLEQKIKLNEQEKQMDEMKDEFTDKLDDIRDEFDRQVKSILALHTHPVTGEPRLVTYRAHDKIQEACQKYVHSEIIHIKETVERIEKIVDSRSPTRVLLENGGAGSGAGR